MTALKPLFSWRSALCDSSLPPTTRHVAMALSLYMNERGDSAFPGPTRLAHDTGLSLRAVKEHLHLLVEQGWLVITEHGGVKGEKRRANAYQASTPVQERTRAGDAPVTLTTGTRADERALPVQEVHPNSSLELLENSRPLPSDLWITVARRLKRREPRIREETLKARGERDYMDRAVDLYARFDVTTLQLAEVLVSEAEVPSGWNCQKRRKAS